MAFHTLWLSGSTPSSPTLWLPTFGTIPCVPHPVSGRHPHLEPSHTGAQQLGHGCLGSASHPQSGTRTRCAAGDVVPVHARSPSQGTSNINTDLLRKAVVFPSFCSHRGPGSLRSHYTKPQRSGGSPPYASEVAGLLTHLEPRHVHTQKLGPRPRASPAEPPECNTANYQPPGGSGRPAHLPPFITLAHSHRTSSLEGPGGEGSPRASSCSYSRARAGFHGNMHPKLRTFWAPPSHLPGHPRPVSTQRRAVPTRLDEADGGPCARR